jgi:hypothetical protein
LWVAHKFDVRPISQGFLRGDGWVALLRDATDTQLVWRKGNKMPIVWTCYCAEEAPAFPDKEDALKSEVSTEDDHSHESADSGSERILPSVRFDLSNITVIEVMPYSMVYGMHPSEFDFDADYGLVPAEQTGVCRFPRPCLADLYTRGRSATAKQVLCLDALC